MEEREFYRRRLPHWHPPNATFFVTFRLEGSLPRSVFREIYEEYFRAKQLLEQTPPENRPQSLYDLYRRAYARYDKALDASSGPRWLEQETIARIVQREIHALHPNHCHVRAYCLMPTHVHLVVDTQEISAPPPRKDGACFTALTYAIWLLKGRTGFLCRKALQLKGRFWSREYYDHVVRNEREYQRILVYVVNNPVKAGLAAYWREWPYTYVAEDELLYVENL
ncbi:MAG: hypothetical protein N2049_03580 [Anaerolineales bacterium]|nr:hypothetical protein [Anaerolineales bacterium]MDW8226484.1 transposase [Anaerolineales bacterium]